MSRLHLVALPVFAYLLVVGEETAQATGADNNEDERRPSKQSLRLPLDSIAGLEVRGINDAGSDPMNIQTNPGIYRGRRAVRIVNEVGATITVSGGQALAIVRTSDLKDGTIEAEVAGFPRQGLSQAREGSSALHSTCKTTARGMKRSICA
jgi:hypothetical protein